MKKLIIIASIIMTGTAFTACTNDPDNMGSSNPIDSTNTRGSAPATYGGENPESPDPPRYQTQYDTNKQPNTMSSEDSANNNR